MKKKSTARKSSVKRKITTSKRKRKFLFWQRGQIALYLLLGVIILGAFVLVSGGPQFDLSGDGNQPAGEIVPEEPDPGRDNLQLRTIKFQACTNRAAVDFLVDTSGSMRNGNKLKNVQDALKSFASNFTDTSVTGLRRYSSNDSILGATSRPVEIDFYKNNKSTFSNAVDRLTADGATNTRTAFAAELQDITAKVTDPRFKDNTFNVVFLSDGIPESSDPGKPPVSQCNGFSSAKYPVCAVYSGQGQTTCRCFDADQDPTTNPQIAQQIQALKSINGKNVRVYSILVFDPSTDGPFESKFKAMMQAIASPDSYYETTDPTKIKEIYGQIAEKICASSGGGTTSTPTP